MKQGDLFGGPPEPKKEAPAHAPKAPAPVSAPPAAAAPIASPLPAVAKPAPVSQPAVAKPVPAPASQPAKPVPAAPSPAMTPVASPLPAAPQAARAPAPAGQARGAPKPPAERKVWTVSQLTLTIKELLEPKLTHVLVRGEITGYRGPNVRGHLYFSIKDAYSQVEVRIWQTMARTLRFALKDGMSVIIEGAVNVYEPSGRYSLIAQRIEPEGVGAQALAFEQLKQKLAAEGLIGEKRRRPPRSLPFLAHRIGLVTSLTGAALRDFLKVLYRRHPRMSVLVCDARVQGEGAPIEVRRAIHWLMNTDVDVIVVTRGGGSSDDLSAFNDEAVVRTIARCPVPVVSAVGHEIDTTLADLAADFRAPTPSAAAEALAPVLSELQLNLANAKMRLRRAIEKRLLERRNGLRAAQARLGDPRRLLVRQQLLLSDSSERMARVVRRRLRDGHAITRELGARLQRARPQAQLRARRELLLQLNDRLRKAGERRLRSAREALSRLELHLERATPRPALHRARQGLAHDGQRLPALIRLRLARARHQLDALRLRLDALSPLAVLGRGYAIARRADDGRVVRTGADVAPGDEIRVRVGADDELTASVTKVKKGRP